MHKITAFYLQYIFKLPIQDKSSYRLKWLCFSYVILSTYADLFIYLLFSAAWNNTKTCEWKDKHRPNSSINSESRSTPLKQVFPPHTHTPPCWMLVIISAGGQKMYHTEHLHICIPERNYKRAHCLANALPLSQGYSHAIAVHISNKKIKWKKNSWIKECTRTPRF